MKIEREVHLLMANKNNRDKVKKILAEYKLPMLVKIAAELYDMKFHGKHYPKYDFDNMLKDILFERTKRLNADFEWTEENKARLLLVSDQLLEVCEKGWKEAKATAADLEKRIKRRDSFLKDYEIEVIIRAYPKIGGERIATDTIECYLGDETLRYMEHGISHCHYDKYINDEDCKTPFSLNKNINWNGEYFNGKFDNDYICYPIH